MTHHYHENFIKRLRYRQIGEISRNSGLSILVCTHRTMIQALTLSYRILPTLWQHEDRKAWKTRKREVKSAESSGTNFKWREIPRPVRNGGSSTFANFVACYLNLATLQSRRFKVYQLNALRDVGVDSKQYQWVIFSGDLPITPSFYVDVQGASRFLFVVLMAGWSDLSQSDIVLSKG